MKIDFSELNKEDFEKLCKRILIEENPQVKTIDGSGGDEGIDSFIGIFNKNVIIWQFKFFLKRLTPSRKKQIEKSLNQADKKHKVQKWILCLPMEFSPAEEKWFQKIKETNKKIKISLLNEHHLRTLIQKHRPIRDEFFRGEEKEQLNRIEKAMKQLRNEADFTEVVYNTGYTEQISAFKIQVIGKDSFTVIEQLKNHLPFRHGLGFKKFKKVTDTVHTTYFYVPFGKSKLKLDMEDEENPFQLSVPYSTRIEIWLRNIISRASVIPETQITCFTSNYRHKQLLLKLIKESLPESTIIKEIDFNRRIKSMVSDRKQYALSITTVQLDPNIIEQVTNETGKNNIDVEIRSNIIHAKKGGLPETSFMKKALGLVKTIRQEGKESDILFFRAKQTDKIVFGKNITFELHNDGRIRFWFKKSDYESRNNMMSVLDKFIDSHN